MNWKNAVLAPPEMSGRYLVQIGYVSDGVIKDFGIYTCKYDSDDKSWFDEEGCCLGDEGIVLVWDYLPNPITLEEFINIK